MASSRGDVLPSPMAYPAVRTLPSKDSRYLYGQRGGLPLSRTTCTASRQPSTILRHRPPVTRFYSALHLTRISPEFHPFGRVDLLAPATATCANSCARRVRLAPAPHRVPRRFLRGPFLRCRRRPGRARAAPIRSTRTRRAIASGFTKGEGRWRAHSRS